MGSAYRLLQLALVVSGVACLSLYPLAVVWPSGWTWEPGPPYQTHLFMMIVGVYATLGVFLLNAARKPEANLSLIWFTVWSSVVHAAIMAVQSSSNLLLTKRACLQAASKPLASAEQHAARRCRRPALTCAARQPERAAFPTEFAVALSSMPQSRTQLPRRSRHRLGPLHVPLEAKRLRHVSVAIPIAAVGDLVTVCPGQHCAHPG
jgi:hypothetical protein